MPTTFATTQPGAPVDYIKYVWGQPVKTDKLNDPDVLEFSLAPIDGSFVRLKRGAYVTITTQLYGVWFTGYITNEPELEYLGTSQGVSAWGYKYQAIGDEYILNLQPLRVQQSFYNTTQGKILRTVITQLTPGLFDVSGIQDGLVVAEYDIQNEMHFSDIVKEFGDQSYFVLRSKSHVMTWKALDDVPATIAIDAHDKNFTPSRLSIKQSSDPLINDATVMGDIEPQDYVSEYFVGDGATGKIPLASSVYGLVEDFLISDDFSGAQIDTQQWLSNGALFDTWVQLSNGFLNVLGGNGTFDVSLQSLNLLPLEGTFRLTHGDFDFVSSSQGFLGGLWKNIPSSTFTDCLYSIKMNGLVLNPIVNGIVDSSQALTVNLAHRYVFRTVVTFSRAHRLYQEYGFVDSTGVVGNVGGTNLDDTVTYTTLIVEIDPNTGNIVQPLPNVNYTTWTNAAVPMSGTINYAYYVPFVASDLHLTLTGVTVSYPLQASLEVMKQVPYGGGGGGTHVVPSPHINKHNDFDGTGIDTNPANLLLNDSANALAIDTSNITYTVDTTGIVHRFDSSGNLLGTLGTFTVSADISEMRVMYTPSNGTWLIAVDGAVWGEHVQGMCISGGPGAGTLTNILGTMYGGLFSGGNQAFWDVDTAGNIWMFENAFGGALAHLPQVLQVTFTGPSVLAIFAQTDWNAAHGWVQSTGCLINPVDGNLYLGGFNAGMVGIVAKVRTSDLAILLSSTTIDGNLPFRMGTDGKWVKTEASIQISRYDAATLTLTDVHNNTAWGFSSPMFYGHYDGTHGRFWAHTLGHIAVVDFANVSPGGLVVLTDPQNPNTDQQFVAGGIIVSPDGSVGVTTFSSSYFGFLDFWSY